MPIVIRMIGLWLIGLAVMSAPKSQAEWLTFAELGPADRSSPYVLDVGPFEVVDVFTVNFSGPELTLWREGHQVSFLAIPSAPKLPNPRTIRGPITLRISGTRFCCAHPKYGALSLWIRPSFTEFFSEPPSPWWPHLKPLPEEFSVESLLPHIDEKAARQRANWETFLRWGLSVGTTEYDDGYWRFLIWGSSWREPLGTVEVSPYGQVFVQE